MTWVTFERLREPVVGSWEHDTASASSTNGYGTVSSWTIYWSCHHATLPSHPTLRHGRRPAIITRFLNPPAYFSTNRMLSWPLTYLGMSYSPLVSVQPYMIKAGCSYLLIILLGIHLGRCQNLISKISQFSLQSRTFIWKLNCAIAHRNGLLVTWKWNPSTSSDWGTLSDKYGSLQAHHYMSTDASPNQSQSILFKVDYNYLIINYKFTI